MTMAYKESREYFHLVLLDDCIIFGSLSYSLVVVWGVGGVVGINNGVFDEKEGGYIGGAIMYTHRGSCIHELDGQEE